MEATRSAASAPSAPGGQILRAARRLYRENLWTFIGVGAIFIPISALAGGAQWILFHLTGVGRFLALDGKRGAGTVGMTLFIGDIGAAVAAAAVTEAVAAALGELDAGRRVNGLRAYALLGRNVRALAGATALQIAIRVLLFLTVVGIPFAIGSLRTSARLTQGRWWRTFGFTVVVDTLVILSGRCPAR